MKKTITLFTCLAFQMSLWAQKPQIPNKPLLFNSSGSEEILQVIQNKEGNYALVGSDANWFLAKDKNALFTTVSAHVGESELKQRVVPIGRRGTQKAQCVVQTRDGGYVLAGFTDSTNNQKKHEAWIVKITELGNRISEAWDITVVSNPNAPSDAEFTAIKEAPNGDIWLTGESEGNLWVVKVDQNGKNQQIIPLTPYPAGAVKVRGNAMAWAENGRDLLIVGLQETKLIEGIEKGLFLTRFNTQNLSFSDSKLYPNAEGTGIIRTHKKDRLAIVGIHHEKNSSYRNALFIYTQENGDTVWSKRFDTKYFKDTHLKSIATSVAEDWEGAFYFVGQSKKERNDKTVDAWIHKIDTNGVLLWKEPIFAGGNGLLGTDGNDVFTSVLSSEHGEVVAVGTHYKGAKTYGWLVKIPPSVSPTNKSRFNLHVEGGRFHDNEDEAVLRPNKRGFYDFWIENRDTVDVYGLQLNVVQTQPQQPAQQLSYYKSIMIGTLRAKEKRYVTIPFSSQNNLSNGELDFAVRYKVFEQTVETDVPHRFHLATREKAQYKLIAKHTFPKSFKEGDTLRFRVSVTDSGDLVARNVRLIMDEPNSTRFITAKTVELGDINPNETKTTDVVLFVEKLFGDNVLSMPVRISVNGNYGNAIDNFVSDKFLSPTISPSPTKPMALKNRIYWQTNRIDSQNGQDSVLTVSDHSVIIRAVLETNREIDQNKYVHVLLNGDTIFQNIKADNIDLTRDTVKSSYPFRYIISAEVSLRDLETLVQIDVNDGKEQIQTSRVRLKKPALPNLHLLTVGVHYKPPRSPLHYTQNDAKSIDSIFKTQTAFFNITKDTILLCSPNTYDTEGSVIRKKILEIAKSGKDSNDIIVVFLSGHGGLRGDEVIFQGSDYDYNNPETYLSYTKDIEEPLKKAKGQKLIFIDACQNRLLAVPAPVKSDDMSDPNQMVEAWDKIVKSKQGYRALLSCSKGEFSYELYPFIPHGAFTQAVLEALQNETVPCQGYGGEKINANRGKLRKDPDYILNFSEMVEFVTKRVPYLTNYYLNGAKQNPREAVEEGIENKDVPIFWIKK